MTGPLSTGRISYIFIMVRDLASMVAFYRDLLGFNVAFMAEGQSAFLRLGESGPQIAFLAGRDGERRGGEEWFLVIDVAGLDAVVDALRERGVEVGPIGDVPFGRAATFADPEGNLIEVHEMKG